MSEGNTSYVLAVDIGTTSVKVLLIDRKGNMQGKHSIGYPLMVPQADRAEQDPELIANTVEQAMAALLQESRIDQQELACISMSSAMHSLIAVDGQGKPLTASIIWADQRSTAQVEALIESGEGIEIYRNTGTPIHPMSPLPKLIWLREQQPELFARAQCFIGIKEYVLHRWFDKYVVDYSIASATGLFNLHKLSWDEQALKRAGISEQQLPEALPTDAVLTNWQASAAERLGVAADTPVVVGASDGVLANLGAGVMNTERIAITIGTSSALRSVVSKPLLQEQGKLFCYALTEGSWVIGGASNNGGIVLRWLVEQLFTEVLTTGGAAAGADPYERLLAIAESVEPGAGGLMFLPMLSGERAPNWDAQARGVFFGLSLAHNKSHMIRAALEGIVFQIASIAGLMERMLSEKPKEAWVSGGFTQSRFGCRLIADILGLPVCVPEVIDSSGLGAAKLGFIAVGQPMEELELEAAERYEPDPVKHALYKEMLPIYERVYERLRGSFTEIASFQRADADSMREVLK